MNINNNLSNNKFECNYCNSTFSSKKTLLFHVKSNKKCLSNRPILSINCIWCKSLFVSKDELNKHYNKCGSDKENIHIITLEQNKQLQEKVKQIEELLEQTIKQKDDIIKQRDDNIEKLQEKLFTIANKPTTTTTNIKTINNIKLNCDKPLNLEYDNVFNMMKNHLNTTYLSQGGYGIGKWFLKYVCTNERGNICIECTDRNRKVFKYKDEEDELKRVTGDDLHKLVKKAYAEFTTTPLYIEFDEWERDQRERGRDTMDILSGLMDYKKDFLNHLSDKTSVSSGTCALTTN